MFRSLILAFVALAGWVWADDVYEIRFATAAPDDTPWADQLKAIKKRVEAESQGRLKIKLFLGSQLGGEKEMIDQMRRGKIQGGGFSTAALAEIVPELQVLELPCLFASLEEADFCIDNAMAEPLGEAMKKKNFQVVAWSENGFRCFGTKSRPIRKPEDLEGLVLRVQESRVHAATFEALGIRAKPLPLTEVVTSLNSGAIEGFDNTPLFMMAAGWHTSIKYLSLTDHIYQPAVIVYQAEFFNALPADLQKILLGDVKNESVRSREGIRALNEDLLRLLKENKVEVIRLSDEAKTEFEDATWAVHEQFKEELGEELLQKCYDAIKRFREQDKD